MIRASESSRDQASILDTTHMLLLCTVEADSRDLAPCQSCQMQIIVKLTMRTPGVSLRRGKLHKVAFVALFKEPYLLSVVRRLDDPIQIRWVTFKVVKHLKGTDILHTHIPIRLKENLPIFIARRMPEKQSASPRHVLVAVPLVKPESMASLEELVACSRQTLPRGEAVVVAPTASAFPRASGRYMTRLAWLRNAFALSFTRCLPLWHLNHFFRAK